MYSEKKKNQQRAVREQFMLSAGDEVKSVIKQYDEKIEKWNRYNSPQSRPRANSLQVSKIPRPEKFGPRWTKSNENISAQNSEASSLLRLKSYPILDVTPETKEPSGLGLNEKYYKMDHLSRGRAAIFNHKKFKDEISRQGTELDVNNLKKVLPRLGFQEKDISVHNDPKRVDIYEILKKLQDEDFTQRDCLMVFVLTHGNENNELLAWDDEYNVEKIWKPFLGDKCKGLAGKPKIFFIVACRGTNSDPGITLHTRRPSTQTDSSPQKQLSYKIPTHADTLIVFSTVQGYFSYREINRGTWYVDALYKEIQSILPGTEINFIELLTAVNRRLATAYATYDLNFIKSTGKGKDVVVPRSNLHICPYFPELNVKLLIRMEPLLHGTSSPPCQSHR